MSRIIPVTGLHRYYESLERQNTKEQTQACDEFLADPERLLKLFMDSLSKFEVYRNLDEGFRSSDRKTLDLANPRQRVVAMLKSSEAIRVHEVDGDYAFRYVGREVNPWRTTRSMFSDGKSGRSSGSGGADYLGRTLGESERPILGEIKAGSDQTAFYAFIQLLNYLSKFATRSQVDRCNVFSVFGGPVTYPPKFDLHILLADFNDRGTKHETIGMTRNLAHVFTQGLVEAGRGGLVGQIRCLGMKGGNYSGNLSAIWKVHP